MRFNFRKISAVIASAVMIGSSAGFAAAANYPAPFVSSGSPSVAVVYGASATGDLAAATNIQTNLIGKVTVSTSTGNTTISGDNVKIEKSSDKLNLGNAINDIQTSLKR